MLCETLLNSVWDIHKLNDISLFKRNSQNVSIRHKKQLLPSCNIEEISQSVRRPRNFFPEGWGGGLSEQLVRRLLSPTICALIFLCSLFESCQEHKHLKLSTETNTWHLTWHKLLMAAIHYLGIIDEKKTLSANLDFLSASFTSTLHLHLYRRKLLSVFSFLPRP